MEHIHCVRRSILKRKSSIQNLKKTEVFNSFCTLLWICDFEMSVCSLLFRVVCVHVQVQETDILSVPMFSNFSNSVAALLDDMDVEIDNVVYIEQLKDEFYGKIPLTQ